MAALNTVPLVFVTALSRVFPSLFTYDQFYWVFLFAKIVSFAILLAIWNSFF
jgi:hypothetical protein